MSLVPLRPILDATDKYSYAQGAFNVNAVCQAEAVIRIHELFRSPAILQGADLANGFMGGRTDFMNATIEDKKIGARNIAAAVKKFAENSPIPIALHLDHGRDFDSVKAAIDGGYTSVMIDGSSLPLKDNIELTREVVKYAHARGVTVEGELGVLAGVEDHVFSEGSTYTNPMDAIRFFKETGTDALAISYGTMHGANKGKNAVVRKEIAIAVKECMRHEHIQGVLVSHGSSTVPKYIVDEINALGGNIQNAYGIPVEQLIEVSHLGIGKINVDTDIRLAVTRNIREFFVNNPSYRSDEHIGPIWELMEKNRAAFDPRVFLPPVMDTVMYGNVPSESVQILTDLIRKGVMEVVGTLIVQFGSVGKAGLVEVKSLDEMAEFYRKKD
ncbi:MAG: class II fructose-bisphosphate aldolase [Bullifex sp.]|nr:class II fructose-bisphosphate aldolase family protein [Spirochaetales bacterium]MDY2815034.1 class II fructose-bisphosphate aldolase [Bullifex sp.]MDD7536476.1 class II fructose-bisphosphate aldolase family protein [Spirochaetales bacterium]MDY3849584.1 class II fructose-bisphosphate aldolase [Bullifex sp.]MDY4798888.1 class II fructose-bisphosphate aldolase [Bullifex sp.]